MSPLIAPNLIDVSPAGARALQPSETVLFDTFPGIFQQPTGAAHAAVLILSPLGYEELCSRTFWANLADRMGAAGIASIRFDYPGTGNALDGQSADLEDWRAAARQAAAELRRRSGLAEIVVMGQGLGGTFALQWADDLAPLQGIAALEPAASGRAYLRGLTAWGRSIAQSSGLSPDSSGRYGVAGFTVSDARAAAIQKLDVARLSPTQVPAILLLEQHGGSVGRLIDGATWARDCTVSRHGFPGYVGLITDPTSAIVPSDAIATILAWMSALPEPAAIEAPLSAQCTGTALVGDGFEEIPVRFGTGGRLVGTLCRPRTADRAGTAVVLAGAGRDHSIGWGRSAVLQARTLAQSGLSSLRFDVGGIGDSRAAAGAPAEILYSRQLCDELRAAVDHLESLGYRSIGLLGRCSGAWAAFTLATEDARIRSLALVNLPYFLWDPSKSLADVIRFSQRSVGDLRATLLSRKGYKRLLKGELDLRGALRFLIRQVDLRVLRPCAPYLGTLTAESRRFHRLHALFGTLRTRGVPVFLGYAVGDASLGELRSFMREDLGRLGRYGNVSLREIPDADHNFTPEPARSRLTGDLAAFFADPRDPAAAGSNAQTERRLHPATQKSDCILVEQL